jgi:cytoskeletal protein RodZ
MAAGFKIRKVKSEQSIGDKLSRARSRKQLSIAEVEEATKVRAKFLLSLESDCWNEIPSEVYGRGYLERYVAFLGLPSVAIMRQYDRERPMYARHCKDAKVELAPKAHFHLPRFVLTPRIFAMAGVGLFALAVVGVVGMQLSQFISVPFIQIATADGQNSSGKAQIIVSGEHYSVKGKTSPGVQEVSVNGIHAEVASTGDFSATVPVKQGANPMRVIAVNRQNHTAEENFLVINQ